MCKCFNRGGVNPSLIAEAAWSSTKEYDDYLSYRQVDEDDDGTFDYIEIAKCNELATDVVIPAEIDGLPVTSIGYAFYGCTSLKSIEIPDSVNSIRYAVSSNGGGIYYFSDCDSLTSVNVSEKNEYFSSIDGILFNKDKTKLLYYPIGKKDEKYSIPDSVTSISGGVFGGRTSLKSIEIPDSVISIGNRAFGGCSSLTSIEIPDSVTSIADNAFAGCTSLTSIKIPDGVTSIGTDAFYGCTSLTSIEIPDSVTSIYDFTFYGCSSLTSIEIPDSVITIGHSAFSETALLENQTGVKYADRWVVECDKDVTSVEIKEGTRGIASSAFYGCESIKSIEIPDSVTSISTQAFRNCKSLESIEIPDSVTSMASSAFVGTALLENQTGVKYADTWVIGCDEDVTAAEIKEGTRGIADNAFSGCKSIKSIEIPDSIKLIGNYAFSNCEGLTSINIPDSITSIGNRAFSGCTGLENITILNPDCKIYDDAATISNGYNWDNGIIYYFKGTIYGYDNSTAQEYADKYEYKFESLGEKPVVKVTVADIIEMQKCLIKIKPITKEIFAQSDLNNDGKFNVFDLIILKRKVINSLN